jgi:predicted nucleotidyltransferase
MYDNSEPADPSLLRHQEKVAEAKAPGCYVCFMKRDEAKSRLQQHEADLKRLGVEHLHMFGSTARGEPNDDSDVDRFFDYEKERLGLFELMDVKEHVTARARQPL